MREPRPTRFDHEGLLAWLGTVVLAVIGIGLVGLWLTTRTIDPATTRGSLENAAEVAVAAAGLLCVLAVGVGASLLLDRAPAARAHRVSPDPARHGAHARSTLTPTPAPAVPHHHPPRHL